MPNHSLTPEQLRERHDKAWAFIVASIRLCSEAHRMLEPLSPTSMPSLELALSELVKAKHSIRRRS